MVANLDHPNIVPLHDVGSTDGFPCYMICKYVEGRDLATQLKKSRLKYQEAAQLMATVADALHYAHKQGCVHRDVKPGNILVDNDGKPYVVDFGLALPEGSFGKGPRYAGTPAYMAPEQAADSSDGAPRASLHVLAASYELGVLTVAFQAGRSASLYCSIW